MDPSTSTRAEFTTHLTSVPVPDSAAPAYHNLANDLKLLLEKLANHPAMAPNLQQTYMTPAASKNKIYFMRDFVGRTLAQMAQIDPTITNQSPNDKEAWDEATGRAKFAKSLICDEQPGMLDMMTEQTYPGQRGKHPEVREDVLEVARRLG